jgi:hypothetical protein
LEANQTTTTKTISQLQLMPMRMPAMRPSSMRLVAARL